MAGSRFWLAMFIGNAFAMFLGVVAGSWWALASFALAVFCGAVWIASDEP